jgi:XTP/dITP diphosphohydrolase
MELLLATRNSGKVREIREICPKHIVWRSLSDFPEVPEAPETGPTFADNARAKALFYSQQTGLTALADDSGLQVLGLGGDPGVHSAIYAGEPRDDVANNRKLIAALRGVPDSQRAAQFCCAMALARSAAILLESFGTVEGVIVDAPRGTNGFGYDPHFFLPQFGRTMAELSPSEKNEISHRGRALREMLEKMSRYFGWP